MKGLFTPKQAVLYRRLIDRLVHGCRKGQGTIGPARVREGIWNANARPNYLPDQHAINELLARMSVKDRRIVANMLSEEFAAGIHWSLVVLHEEGVEPFHEGYTGTPFHDFVTRLDGVRWKRFLGNE